MKHAGSLFSIALAAVTITTTSIAAAQPAQICVPRATGVPTREGPPKWLGWGDPRPPDPALDDPRWLGATAQAFSLGGARAPLHARALWAPMATPTGTKDFLFLSFIVDLEGLEVDSTTTPRDLFIGFRRPMPLATPDGPERAYIFQFHLNSGGTGVIRPEHCTDHATCSENPGPGLDYWRVFVDRGLPAESCTAGSSTVSGTPFRPLTGSFHGDAPVDWMTRPAASADEDAVRFWKLDASQPPLLQNRWAVQLRIPIAATDNLPLTEGIPPGSRIWYQGTAQLAGSTGYAKIGWWPRALTDSVCVKASTPNTLVHPQLGTAGNYSALTTYAGAVPAGCGGITIESANIGAIFNAPAGTPFATAPLTNTFRAGQRADGSEIPNTVVAQMVNTTSAPITASFLARFRLASWGAAPWSTSDTGKWRDLRVAPNGACAAGSLPACSPYTVPASGRGAITVQWAIGADPTLGKSEYCQFGLTPPGGTCSACSCGGAGAACYAPADNGTRATVGGTAFPCVSQIYRHDQCMLVELQAPNGDVNFVQQSAWHNMQFDQMSTVAREALIDARHLPVAPGQKEQDIYLIAMARNLPQAIPSQVQDGSLFVRERALARAEQIAAAYQQDLAKLTPGQIKEIADKLGRQQIPLPVAPAPDVAGDRQRLGPHIDVQILKIFAERFKKVAPALQIMPDGDYHRVLGLLRIVGAKASATAAELTEAVVREVGPVEAAGVVPTLEVYPFYLHLGAGQAYAPMTAFTVFLSHEGAMTGMTWTIDGATRVGQNTYRLQIPVGFARRIQVRAQAIEGGDALLAPPNPRWPCQGGGCCAPKNCGLVGQRGNGLPGLLAGIYVVLRGRRRRPAARPALWP